MKEKELREVAECAVCGKKIGDCGLPMFFRVRIQQYIVDGRALQRQAGLGMMIGPQLAMVMGADEDLATMLLEREITVCCACAMEKQVGIAALILADDTAASTQQAAGLPLETAADPQ
jgi:hypothetical protein